MVKKREENKEVKMTDLAKQETVGDGEKKKRRRRKDINSDREREAEQTDAGREEKNIYIEMGRNKT